VSVCGAVAIDRNVNTLWWRPPADNAPGVNQSAKEIQHWSSFDGFDRPAALVEKMHLSLSPTNSDISLLLLL
jgi:hypothetical protein